MNWQHCKQTKKKQHHEKGGRKPTRQHHLDQQHDLLVLFSHFHKPVEENPFEILKHVRIFSAHQVHVLWGSRIKIIASFVNVELTGYLGGQFERSGLEVPIPGTD